MAEGAIFPKNALTIIVVTWILSLITTFALVYFAPTIFPPLQSAHIADEAIITAKLADGTVTSAKIFDGTITAQDLATGSVTSIKIADGAITTTKIADASVTTSKISDASVIASKIADGAIVSVKLADGSVNSAKILDGTVTAVDLADSSVISIKIADGAVSTVKIADYAVTNNKLAPSAIPYASTFNTTDESTSSTSFVDMPDTSVSMTLTRESHLIIMFSAEAWLDGAGDSILIQALVDSTVANPTGGLVVLTTAGPGQRGVNSFVFYLPNVSGGTHTIWIQWTMLAGMNVGHVAERTLNVIALPA